MVWMVLRGLGGLALTGSRFGRHKPLLLLTYLSLEGAKSRRFLAELLWPSSDRPRHNLEMALYHLRRAAPDAISGDENRVWTTVECDAAQLRRAAAEHRWHDVIDLYRGSFLDGIDVSAAMSEFEEWVLETRELLAALALRALVEVAERARTAGDLRNATELAERAAVLLPATVYDDAGLLVRLHALLVALDSPRASAIRHEAAEVGVNLDTQTGSVSARISSGIINRTLPSDATPFIGRVRELNDLDTLMTTGARVVSIHGLGGMGKTRLAVALANRQAARGVFDEVQFVAMETTGDPETLLERIAHVLAVDGVAVQDVAAIGERLGHKRVLLLLDDVAPDTANADLVAELASACPQLTIVTTSLRPLDVHGASLYAIDGLRLPQTTIEAMERGSEFGGTYLFMRTAQRYDPHFALTDGNTPDVIAICRSVAGSPLAIEMAAALARVVSPAELARDVASDLDALVATTDTVPPRHASMRAVFGRSWAELDVAGRLGMAGASVFRGGFTRAAASAVLDMHLPALTSLLDRSLLRRNGNRYTLHRLVQQYAAEQLAGSDTAEAVRERHAEYFCALLEAKGSFANRAGERVAYLELDSEFSNIRAAWDWAVGTARTELLDRMLPPLARYLLTRRRLTELRRALDGAAAIVANQTPLQARLLRARAEALMTEDPRQAMALFDRSLAIFRQHELVEEQGAVLHLYATAALFSADFAGGRALALTAKPLLERHDPEGFLGACYAQLAQTTSDASEWEALMDRAAASHAALGHLSEVSPLLYGQACHLVTTRGDYSAALRRLEEAIDLERDQVDRGYLLGHLHTAAGYCAVQLDDLPGAALHLSQSERLFSDMRTWEGRQEWEGPSTPGAQLDNWGRAYLHHANGRLEEARGDALRATDYPFAAELLIHLEIDSGRLSDAERHTEELSEEVFGPLGVRQVDYLRVLKHLFRVEIAVARRAGDGAVSSTDANGIAQSGTERLAGEILSALALIRDGEFAPLMFEAILATRLIAPSAVGEPLLMLAASHPPSRLHTRQRAAALLAESHTPAPDPGNRVDWPEHVLDVVPVLEAGLAELASAPRR